MLLEDQKTIPTSKATIIIGPQGSGKSQLAKQMAEEYRFPVFTTLTNKDEIVKVCAPHTDLVVIDGICSANTHIAESLISSIHDGLIIDTWLRYGAKIRPHFIFVMQSYPQFKYQQSYAHFEFINTAQKN
jgi:adenylate kinase family enzyme